MSDNKKKPAEAEGEVAKKKGLPPIVLVAVGAALGGAGMVFFSPKPEPAPVEHHEPEPKFELREHPDEIKLHFNPRQERGSMTAKLEFLFVYKLDVLHEPAVLELIKTNWNQMSSRVLLRLRRETPQNLKDPDAILHLENDLIAEMSLALFPQGEAVVKQIIWKNLYLQ